ncbi:hypothetical protein PCASD_02190 [Puccinia coronata f. sp. avenae]|uniref:Uncharacterized protein n=1 Tax=Puccinia coronata f. sp. avenae TaxID=200324 RepID=A0A2N5VHX1_9BASI|nr:hypothetical protein PCASD_22124 [Puccinia coronata f. sp. avenae]PLW49603.1 hypothetical protein PCASD_02190 [Puccinia coronata f. sp. avenae]
MDSHAEHPMSLLVDTMAESSSTHTTAILSPRLQCSFVFHTALALLHREADLHPDDPPSQDPVVAVVGKSEAGFQSQLAEENDALLFARPGRVPDARLAGLLERIQFRFVPDLPQLLVLLSDLTRPSIESEPAAHDETAGAAAGPRNGPIAGLVISDLSSYFSSSSATLSNLTRLLGFVSATQARLASIHPLDHRRPPPVIIMDRIDPSSKWPLSSSSSLLSSSSSIETADSGDGGHLREVLPVFRYFFRDTWSIEPLLDKDTSSNRNHTYRLFQSSSSFDKSTPSNHHHPQIVYQVVESIQQDPYTGPSLLRQTVVVHT